MHLSSDRFPDYPVKKSFKELRKPLEQSRKLAVEAPTGSGKTTLLPLLMLESGLARKKILLTQPRRLAAKSVALRMAQLTETPAGELIGYRLRGESRVSAETKIEVVTEGYALAMLQADPFMSDYDWIIIDEFHERHIEGDLLLAFMRDLNRNLGPEESPGLVLMTATWQGQPMEALADFTFNSTEGKLFPVKHRFFRGSPDSQLHQKLEWGIEQALEETDGKILVFLPGRRELDEAYARLSTRNSGLEVSMLYGGMELSEQQRVMCYSGQKRQVILATAVAETSLTIEGITAVVDSGLERLPLYQPQLGLTRLVTRRLSRATADQRSGRAGRLGPGICYRLWSESEDRELIERWDPEILTGDLSRARLQSALWNSADLPWVTPPPEGHWKQAGELLTGLDAIDGSGRITERGKRMISLPLSPRIAHMVLSAPDRDEAALAAAVLSEGYRFRLSGTFSERLYAAKSRRDLAPLRREAEAIAARIDKSLKTASGSIALGVLLALAYPDRIGRMISAGRYELSGGQNVMCRACNFAWAVFPEIHGNENSLTAPFAEELSIEELRKIQPELFRIREKVNYSPENGRFKTSRSEVIGNITLKKLPAEVPGRAQKAAALLDFLNKRGIDGLQLNRSSQTLLSRLRMAEQCGITDLPSGHPEQIIKEIKDWLDPWLDSDLSPAAMEQALKARLSWEQSRLLDEMIPLKISLRRGQQKTIDYSNPVQPKIRGRLQEFYGLSSPVTIAGGRILIAVELLSPAMRPLQITTDLAEFWKGSYQQIRGEMRGRYPKHFWPENPASAEPSLATGKNRPEET